jgi:hypothetical protein
MLEWSLLVPIVGVSTALRFAAGPAAEMIAGTEEYDD